MKKLRLLLFENCHRHCEGCCNKQFDLKALPLVKTWQGWGKIVLTGGEPMLNPEYVLGVIDAIRAEVPTPIYLYTAKVSNYRALTEILLRIDGLTVTLHEQSDVPDFAGLLTYLEAVNFDLRLRSKSLRLNVFEGVSVSAVQLEGWKVKDNMRWIMDCPLPEGETLMRLRAP